MNDRQKIIGIDIWQTRVPLAKSYHLSHVLGTMTHAQGFIVRLTLANGIVGWGEGNPQFDFDGFTQQTGHQALLENARKLIGQDVADILHAESQESNHGAPAAALDIACFDAIGKVRELPVWKLLGTQVRDRIDVLWPTSNGTAADDLEIVAKRFPQGFRTYMMKMGSQPISEEIERTREVIASLPAGVRVMIDANQGWTLEQAKEYLTRCGDLPVILVEQPLHADDISGLAELRRNSRIPISVDEAVSTLQEARDVIVADAADIFSIKVSKNGGLTNSNKLAGLVKSAGKKILMNSMIELGLCQAASLQLAVTLDNILPCGHAYMSTLRMADDITNFSDLVRDGTVYVPNRPGLGVDVSIDKISQYQFDHTQLG